VRDNQSEAHIRRRGHFRPAAVENILDDHFAGTHDASNKIFTMMMLELWYQTFVDRPLEFTAGAPAPGGEQAIRHQLSPA
jgi:hypothetical protein